MDVKKYIEKEQKRIVKIVTEKFKDYYLTGGTALGIYYGHRFSEDLDFFTQKYNRTDPDKIMHYIAEKTGYSYRLEAEQKSKKMIPLKVYNIELKKGVVLKIDFVKDYVKNIDAVKNGLHSIRDIYIRKIIAAIGTGERQSETGGVDNAGRQAVKDLYDIYWLSKKHKRISGFFFEYFNHNRAEKLIIWYKKFNRTDLKMELLDLVSGIDTAEVIKYLDDEILKQFPDKIISGGYKS